MDDSKLLSLTNISLPRPSRRHPLGDHEELMSRSCDVFMRPFEYEEGEDNDYKEDQEYYLSEIKTRREKKKHHQHSSSLGLPGDLHQKKSKTKREDFIHDLDSKKRRKRSLQQLQFEENKHRLEGPRVLGGLPNRLEPSHHQHHKWSKPLPSSIQYNHNHNMSHMDHEEKLRKVDSPVFERLSKSSFANLAKTRPKNIPKRLKAIENQFHGEHQYLSHMQHLANLKTIHDIDQFVNEMPLQFLYSQPALRKHAIYRACERLLLPAQRKAHRLTLFAWKRWKRFSDHIGQKEKQEMVLNDKQIGFLVIAKQLNSLVLKQCKRYFKIWSFQFGSKYDDIRDKEFNDSAYLIQHWFAQRMILRRQPFKDALGVFRMCLHRRQAIYYMISFEHKRKRAVEKIRRGIANRRRYYFAARIIQRIVRFVLIYREMKYRLTRKINGRKIQRWRRRVMRRSRKAMVIIKLVLRLGGYSKVMQRLTERLTIPGSLHRSIEEAVSTIQRSYLRSCGRYQEYLALKAERMKHEREERKHQAIVTIQRFWLRVLHKEIMRCAVLHNRARVIQRSFRHYQFRAPIQPPVPILQLCRERFHVLVIQRFVRRRLFHRQLMQRFPLRKRQLQCERRLRRISASKIQVAYRAHVIYAAKKKEEMRLFFNAQRESGDVFLRCVRTVQRAFRHSRRPYSMLPRHVRLFAFNLWRKWRLKRWTAACRIQRVALDYIEYLKVKDFLLRVASVNKIWRLSKSYGLRNRMYQLVMATRRRRNAAAMKLQWNLRTFVWLFKIRQRFVVMKERIRIERLRNKCATIIQRFYRRVEERYRYPVRVAARVMIKKRREEELHRRMELLWQDSIRPIVRLFQMNRKWRRFLRVAEKIRYQILENKMAKRIQRMVRFFLARARVAQCIRRRHEQAEAERIRKLHQHACGIIGKYVRRKRELYSLKNRFNLRKLVIEEQNRLEAARQQALKERQEALDEAKQTEDNMTATIKASWKQGSDVSGRNYYYNYVTGESQWDPPEDWVLKPIDAWIRNINDRGQVYYYNQQTDESRWLPPCVECSGEAERWCKNCCLSYCTKHFEELHDQEGGDPDMADHTWAVAELEKETLKPGEVYCIECKKRVCSRVCVVCWDNYCDYCFKYVHHVGDLKRHDSIPFRKAKRGWNTVKPRTKDDKVYYVNGTTGETTYDKPRSLMTPQELQYYDNFISHKDAAEKHVKRIDELQHEVEALKYERDMRLANDAAKMGQQAAGGDTKKKDGAETLAAVKNAKTGPLAFITGISQAYKARLLNPEARVRGQNRSDYIKSLLQNPDR